MKSALTIICEEQRNGWQMAYVLCTFSENKELEKLPSYSKEMSKMGLEF